VRKDAFSLRGKLLLNKGIRRAIITREKTVGAKKLSEGVKKTASKKPFFSTEKPSRGKNTNLGPFLGEKTPPQTPPGFRRNLPS